jgi:tripartite-type tricarboxylate transporter receptor subunit TctC
MVPPKTPRDRLQTLRLALQKTVADADFLAEAKKSKLVIGKVTGEDIEQSVEEILTIAPNVKKKLMVLSPGKTTTN